VGFLAAGDVWHGDLVENYLFRTQSYGDDIGPTDGHAARSTFK